MQIAQQHLLVLFRPRAAAKPASPSETSVRISQKKEGELGGHRCGSELKFLELPSLFLGAFLAPRPSLETEMVYVSWGGGQQLETGARTQGLWSTGPCLLVTRS